MELGEKLRHARLEAGLSQRQLCGEEITRNMLSLVENGSARPSMDTLKYLAGRLGKPVSYFLEETAVVSRNMDLMESARRLHDAGQWEQAALVLQGYQAPDPVYDREKNLLWALVHLALGEKALEEKRERYALELLEKAEGKVEYCYAELERRRLLLLGGIRGQRVSDRLPSLDRELLLRGEEALEDGSFERAGQLLEAMEGREPLWQLLRGRAYLGQKCYEKALTCFQRAENAYPKEVAAGAEHCCRELGDYRQAYEYACKQR